MVVLGQEKPTVDYNARLVEVLEDYRKLLSIELDEDVKDTAAADWDVLAWAIGEGYVRFTVNPESNGLLSGARFKVPSTEKAVTYIIVTRELLDLWDTHPSTIYSIIARAIHEAAVFFRGPENWARIVQDDMEHLFMNLDGYAAQTELIQNRLLPEAYLLSAYDTYLLDSYDLDGLASVILFLENFSLPVAQELYAARLAYEENNDGKSLRSLILNLGRKLLENRDGLSKSSEDMTVYPIAVAVHTWLEFSPELIARIHNKARRDNPLTFDKILAREKDYDKLRQSLETSRTRDLPLIERIIKETQGKFTAKD